MTAMPAQILIVDDRPDNEAESIASALRGQSLRVDVAHPEDVLDDQLKRVDLLLVDYDLSQWSQQTIPVSNMCASGWSLAALLRDKARSLDERRSATGTAILTSMMDQATMPFTSAGRAHISAELNGIEWVFNKNDSLLAEKVSSLAKSTRSVARDWTVRDLLKALGLKPGDTSKEQDVLRCRPPLAESLAWQDGLGFIRWMLHRILPYPTFLIDEFQLAARFGLSVTDTRALLDGRSKLAKELAGERYGGLLSQFAGARWWRVGIDALMWRLSEGRPSDVQRLQKLAAKALRTLKEPLPKNAFNLVTCYDEDLCPLPRPVDASQAVRIWPDDWPPYASQPWATTEAVQESDALSRFASPLGTP